MYYSAPVIKKGMIRNPHCMNPGYSHYSGAHYEGLLECGNIWLPRTSRLAKCPEMKRQHDIFIKNKNLMKKKGSWPYCGSKVKKYRDNMAEAERLGKAAWKTCKVQTKAADLAPEMELSTSFVPLVPDYMQEGSTMSQPGAVDDVYIDYTAGAGAGAGALPSTDMAEANKKLMLYGGIAAGGLLLLLLLRR